MTKKIKKKVVWITGGGTGIGKELAKLFSDNNYIVVISGRRISKLNEVKSYNTKNINSIKLDVSNHKECSRAVKLIIKKFNSIDLIFLNAATYNPGPLDELDQIKIKRIVNTNVIGPINCLSPALELMKKKKLDILFLYHHLQVLEDFQALECMVLLNQLLRFWQRR